MARNRAYLILALLLACGLYLFTGSYAALLLLSLCALLPLCSLALLLAGRRGVKATLFAQATMPDKCGVKATTPDERGVKATLFAQATTPDECGSSGLTLRVQGMRPWSGARLCFTLYAQNRLMGVRDCARIRCAPFFGGDADMALCPPRGVVQDGAWPVGHWVFQAQKQRLCDALGVFCVRLPAIPDCDCVIRPAFAACLVRQTGAADATAVLERRTLHRRGSDTAEVHRLRDYLPGDSVRAIHWKLSARAQDKPIVREFGATQALTAAVLVELLQGGDDIRQFSDCMRLAAGVSAGLARAGIAHRVIWYAGSELCSRPVSCEADAYDALTRLLCGARGQSAAHTLSRYAQTATEACTLVYVSSQAPAGDATRLLQALAAKQCVRAVTSAPIDAATRGAQRAIRISPDEAAHGWTLWL